MSASDDEDSGESVASEDDFVLRVPNTSAEAAALLYEVASRLEMSKEWKSDVGVQQLVACADGVIDGKISITQAEMLAREWQRAAMDHSSGVACGSAASAARKMSAQGVPPVLWVISPNHWEHCQGCYQLQPETVNGRPMWKRCAGSARETRYLYGTTTEKWRVTNDPADFGHGGGYLLSAVHRGALPHQVDSWTVKGEEDPAVQVTAQHGDAVTFHDADGDTVTLFALSNSRCQYAVNGIPRPPVHFVSFDMNGPSLVFPKEALEVELSWSTLVKDLTDIKKVVLLSGICAELPHPARLWLSEWSVVPPDAHGRPAYFYQRSLRETTWNLCSKLEECLKLC